MPKKRHKPEEIGARLAHIDAHLQKPSRSVGIVRAVGVGAHALQSFFDVRS